MVEILIPLESRAEGICVKGSNHYFGNDRLFKISFFRVLDENDLMAKAKCAGANAYCLVRGDDKKDNGGGESLGGRRRRKEGVDRVKGDVNGFRRKSVFLYYIDEECYQFGLKVLGVGED